MLFAYTILYVKNVRATIEFYERAFGLERKFLSPDGIYGELNTGGTALSFCCHTLASANLADGYTESSIREKPFGFEIGFTTPDVAAAVEKAVAAGAILTAPTKTKPWGQTVAYLRDPNGFLVELCTPMG
jgi:lactoylglutathione lyase